MVWNYGGKLTLGLQLGRGTLMRNLSASTVAVALAIVGPGTAFAAGPPNLDVSESCNAATFGAVSAARDKQACLEDERTAKDQLTKVWNTFAQDVKASCIGMNRTGGPPSYVELLTCLEVLRDARASERHDPLVSGLPTQSTTTGVAPGGPGQR